MSPTLTTRRRKSAATMTITTCVTMLITSWSTRKNATLSTLISTALLSTRYIPSTSLHCVIIFILVNFCLGYSLFFPSRRMGQVERLLNELVEILSSRLRLTPSLSKLLLHAHQWALERVVTMYLEGASQLLVCSRLKADHRYMNLKLNGHKQNFGRVVHRVTGLGLGHSNSFSKQLLKELKWLLLTRVLMRFIVQT